MKPELKKAVLKKETQKFSREIISENPEAYVYSSICFTNIPDDVKKEIIQKHEQFWEEMLQMIEVCTEWKVVQAPKPTGDSIHKYQ